MIEIKAGTIFAKLAKKYKIKYRRTPEKGTYEINDKESNTGLLPLNMDKVSDCLYANVPKTLRYKSINDNDENMSENQVYKNL